MSHAQQYQNPALEEFANGSAKRATRIYLERLAFTQRGRFAYLVGLLISVLTNLQVIQTDGVPLQFYQRVSQPTTLEAVINTLSLVLTFLVPVVAGIALLLAMDAYEEEVGLVINDG